MNASLNFPPPPPFGAAFRALARHALWALCLVLGSIGVADLMGGGLHSHLDLLLKGSVMLSLATILTISNPLKGR